jgi:hypothetical protein
MCARTAREHEDYFDSQSERKLSTGCEEFEGTGNNRKRFFFRQDSALHHNLLLTRESHPFPVYLSHSEASEKYRLGVQMKKEGETKNSRRICYRSGLVSLGQPGLRFDDGHSNHCRETQTHVNVVP